MEEKKKPNKLLYTILMVVVFIIIAVLLIWGVISSFIYRSVSSYPQGALVIKEAILAVLVLIVMLLFKNSYVFTQKREKLRTGIFYGLFYLLVAAFFMLIFGVAGGGFRNVYAVANILIGCFLVGVAEEFLCRGWILNEFLERFGDSKKGVWFSIIVSGSFFGLMHLGNILGGQAISTTISQVIHALSTGIVLGVIYYKTKNIWSVILLHGLWDFSLFLGDIAPSYSATVSDTNTSFLSLVFAILIALSELLVIVPHTKDIEGKPKKGAVIGFGILAAACFIIFSFVSIMVSKDEGETYEYGKISLENYTITTYLYDEYEMTNGDVTLKLKEDNNKLILSNGNYEVTLLDEESYDYVVIDNNNQYILAYIDSDSSSNAFLYYTFISKSSIRDDSEYLNDIKQNMKMYLLPDKMELLSINAKGTTYLSTYEPDRGYYLLTSETELSILE